MQPLMSVKKKVTVPVGRLGMRGLPDGQNGPAYIKATFAGEASCLLRVLDVKGVPGGND